MRLPDFIVAGAPRSGTTWLYSLLDRHPDVFMAKPHAPEPKFFLVDDLYAQGLERYARWFEDAAGRQLAGEKSTNYLESRTVPERIARDLPGIKLVFILREPVARAYSNFLWSRMHGKEDRDFQTAIALEAEREAQVPPELRFARPHAYFSRGLYADLLQRYFDRFRREQILILRFEDVLERPGDVATTLHRFLGVAEREQDSVGLGVVNPSEDSNLVIPESVIAALHERYVEPNARLRAMLGDGFRMWDR